MKGKRQVCIPLCIPCGRDMSPLDWLHDTNRPRNQETNGRPVLYTQATASRSTLAPLVVNTYVASWLASVLASRQLSLVKHLP